MVVNVVCMTWASWGLRRVWRKRWEALAQRVEKEREEREEGKLGEEEESEKGEERDLI